MDAYSRALPLFPHLVVGSGRGGVRTGIRNALDAAPRPISRPRTRRLPGPRHRHRASIVDLDEDQAPGRGGHAWSHQRATAPAVTLTGLDGWERRPRDALMGDGVMPAANGAAGAEHPPIVNLEVQLLPREDSARCLQRLILPPASTCEASSEELGDMLVARKEVHAGMEILPEMERWSRPARRSWSPRSSALAARRRGRSAPALPSPSREDVRIRLR